MAPSREADGGQQAAASSGMYIDFLLKDAYLIGEATVTQSIETKKRPVADDNTSPQFKRQRTVGEEQVSIIVVDDTS